MLAKIILFFLNFFHVRPSVGSSVEGRLGHGYCFDGTIIDHPAKHLWLVIHGNVYEIDEVDGRKYVVKESEKFSAPFENVISITKLPSNVSPMLNLMFVITLMVNLIVVFNIISSVNEYFFLKTIGKASCILEIGCNFLIAWASTVLLEIFINEENKKT